MRIILALLLLCTTTFVNAQSKRAVTVEDIWEKYQFLARGVSGLKSLEDGAHFSTHTMHNRQTIILKHSYESGDVVDTIFSTALIKDEFDAVIDDYEISSDERFILLFTEKESIYRYSSKSIVYVFDKNTGMLHHISHEKVQLPNVSPDARFVSFVKNNNLYLFNLERQSVKALTDDGLKNHIIYGATDWVYEEEFQFDKGYEWSPDGRFLAYYRFDESAVKEFSMDVYGDGLYPEQERFKYPKAGEENALVSIHIYDVAAHKSKPIGIENQPEYVGRIKWRSKNELALFTLNRHQNELKIFNYHADRSSIEVWYTEKDDAFVEMDDDQFFLEDGSLIRLSGKDGHYHLYQIFGQKKQKQITSGKWDVTALYGYHPDSDRIFFQAAKDHPTERGVYSVKLNGKSLSELHTEKGWNSASFSKQCRYFINNYSRVGHPNSYALYDNEGKEIRVLKDNAEVKKHIEKSFQLGTTEFFSFTTTEKVSLNGYMIKPVDFNAKKKYPVLMFVYGGPGSQMVKNSYDPFNHFWYQHLASKGYIVVCVDNRGTGARGRDFKKVTYKQIGHYELIDQMEAARWLGKQSYIDPDRIGIWGWSYGGYMSSLCITRGADLFKMAIAVAPVTTWRYYNTIYTERYMRTPQENPEGYDDNSPVEYAKKLKGKYLLIHGTADDNVHVQNAMQMVKALVEENKPFEQFMYPDKNHGIFGGPTRLHLYLMMTRFVEDNL
ncbi:MAG: S9 family peptidase [Cryomorphaceae bacterium]|nr:S9 family peptidase [Cryomorphaceae bacterium]